MGQTRVLEGLLTLFGRLAEQGPVMLIVEDLHWATGRPATSSTSSPGAWVPIAS